MLLNASMSIYDLFIDENGVFNRHDEWGSVN